LYLLDGATIAVPTEVLQKAAGDGRVHAYLGERIVIEVHDPMYAVEIDELEDVQLAEFYLAADRGQSRNASTADPRR
jgi:hypothetical protein